MSQKLCSANCLIMLVMERLEGVSSAGFKPFGGSGQQVEDG